MEADFFKGIKVRKSEKAGLEDLIVSWGVLSKQLSKIKSERTFKKLILLEIEGKGRLQIIQRLKARFNKLRNERENREILGGHHAG